VHGVLSGSALERVEKSPLEELIVTNTIPLESARERSDKLHVLSVATLLGNAIKNIHEETSVSSLFV
jgi:ribose-phosphate pyrophosphokinase